MAQNEMFGLILHELRYLRKRLDDHVDDEDNSVVAMRKDIEGIKEELSTHRVKIGLALTVITAAFTGAMTWISTHISKIADS